MTADRPAALARAEADAPCGRPATGSACAFPLAPLTSFRHRRPGRPVPGAGRRRRPRGGGGARSRRPACRGPSSARVRTSWSPTRGFAGPGAPPRARATGGRRGTARRSAPAGRCRCPRSSGVALSHGLAGLEFGVAIPATLGGAVRMNAGAHHGVDGRGGPVGGCLRARPGGAGARAGAPRRVRLPALGAAGGSIVVEATLGLRPGDPAAIRREMEEARAWRRETQPLAEPNCGSVFKNPEGDHAARLVEAAGAKGRAVGRRAGVREARELHRGLARGDRLGRAGSSSARCSAWSRTASACPWNGRCSLSATSTARDGLTRRLGPRRRLRSTGRAGGGCWRWRSPSWSPAASRGSANSPVFRMRHLHVTGVRHLSQADVARLAGLTSRTNVIWMSGGERGAAAGGGSMDRLGRRFPAPARRDRHRHPGADRRGAVAAARAAVPAGLGRRTVLGPQRPRPASRCPSCDWRTLSRGRPRPPRPIAA